MVSSMIGMILCGGYGKRLAALTGEMPKAMIDIKKNYTLLDSQLFAYEIKMARKRELFTDFM